MHDQERHSDIARMRQQIASEYQAAQRGLTGLAQGTAQHAFITARLERISDYQAQLATLIGEVEAIRSIYAIFEANPEGALHAD